MSFDPDERLAAWPITAYGKTPTAFLQTDEEAVNLAAVVALRDAGAHFVTSFGATPDVAVWLNGIARREQDAARSSNDQAGDPQPVVDSAEASPAEGEPESGEAL